jgi:C4-dicarboxylate-specific signal transduction histidine kinase
MIDVSLARSLARDGDEAELTVTNNGMGMAADFLPTTFRIFVRAERSLDRKGVGLRLGLAHVYQLASHASWNRAGGGSRHKSREAMEEGAGTRPPIDSHSTQTQRRLLTWSGVVLPANRLPKWVLV